MSPEPEIPGGDAANEVLGSNKITQSAAPYLDAAQTHLQNASTVGQAAGAAGQGAQQAAEDNGKWANRAAELFGLSQQAFSGHNETHANDALWYQYVAGVIEQSKAAQRAAVLSHEPFHDMPFKGSQVKDAKDANLQETQQQARSAKLAVDQAIMDAVSGMRSGKAPPVTKQASNDKDDPHKTQVSDKDGLPSNAPTSNTPTTSPASPSTTSSPPSQSSTPSTSAPAAPSSGAPATHSVGAPGAASAPTPAPVASAGGAPASSGAAPSSAASPFGGVPMMPPPQMPQSPPGGASSPLGSDPIRSISDAIRGGHNGANGVPLDAKTLDKLLDAQADTNGSGGGHKVPADIKVHDPITKPVEQPQSTHTTLSGPQQAYPSNQTLGAPVGPPSPAALAVTPPPAVSHAPVTQLSADPTPPQQHETHTSGSNAPPAQTLGAYPNGQFAPGPMPVAAGMGAAPMTAAGVSAASAPILAVAPVTQQETKLSSRVADRNERAIKNAVAPPVEFVRADAHLAALANAYITGGWAATQIAVGVLVDSDDEVEYVVATADALCLFPLGVRIPSGLSALTASDAFVCDWGGCRRVGDKLAAYAKRKDVELAYVVSNTPVDEHFQSDSARKQLIDSGRASFAGFVRSDVMTPRIPRDKAASMLDAFGKAWGFSGQTDFMTAKARLWAARWDDIPTYNYLATLATYLHAEGKLAVAQNRLADAAYSVSALAAVPPLKR